MAPVTDTVAGPRVSPRRNGIEIEAFHPISFPASLITNRDCAVTLIRPSVEKKHSREAS